MARSRNIKPAFFRNEVLAECSPWARLAFVGLWTLADREGRLEDRPKRIKGDLFAYDDVDVDGLMQELATRGFIARYQVGDLKLIQIINFTKHQAPHHREGHSTLPPAQIAGPAAAQTIASTQAQVEPEASPGLAQDQPKSSPVAAHLIPDSGFLIPDSTVAGATAAAEPQPTAEPAKTVQVATAKPMTAKERVFELGVAMLGDKGRSLLGKWASTYGDQLLAEVLADAAAESPHEPKAWIVKALEARNRSAPRRGGYEPDRRIDERPPWLVGTGFATLFEAESAGCGPGNYRDFTNGLRAIA